MECRTWRLSPFLALTAAFLAFGALASDAFAAPRGGHGFRGGGRIAAVALYALSRRLTGPAAP